MSWIESTTSRARSETSFSKLKKRIGLIHLPVADSWEGGLCGVLGMQPLSTSAGKRERELGSNRVQIPPAENSACVYRRGRYVSAERGRTGAVSRGVETGGSRGEWSRARERIGVEEC